MNIVTTRIAVGLGSFIFLAIPLSILAKLSNDIRNFELLSLYKEAESELPRISSFLWVIAPLDWWGYFAPFALSIGISFRVRCALKINDLGLFLFLIIFQSIVVVSSFLPYGKLYNIVGNNPINSYSVKVFSVNLVFVFVSILFAIISIKKSK